MVALVWVAALGLVENPSTSASSVTSVVGVTSIASALLLAMTAALLWSLRSSERIFARLKSERDLLSQIVQSEPACVKVVSRDLKLLEMNGAGLRMIGAPDMASVRNADLRDVIHPEHSAQFQDLNDRVFEGASLTDKFRIISLDGTVRWMETHAAPLYGRDGNVDAHVAVTYDVSERVQIERKLEASTSRLSALIDTAVDGVLVLGRGGKIERRNPAASELFGEVDATLPDQNFMDLLSREGEENGSLAQAETFETFVGRYRDASASGSIQASFEEIGRRRTGDTFPVLVSLGEVAESAGGGFVVIVHDLTNRIRTQSQLAQAQKMEAVGQLSGGIAHDFNNLLTVILGNAQLLEEELGEGGAASDQVETATMISEAGQRGVALTQRLLSFGRRQVLQPVSTQCDVLVRDMQGWLRRTLRDDIAVTTRLEENLHPIYADRSQLDTALLNLAINAQDALPDGGKLIFSAHNLNVREEEDAQLLNLRRGSYVVLSVTDNGAGMSAEVRERALDPFFTTKEVGKGTGLGLSMVYGFAKQSGGHLTITSDVGLGTTIRIYLPADEGMDKEQHESKVFALKQTDEDSRRCVGAKVLVVEDDPLVRTYVTHCLRSLGYQSLAATDGAEALSKLDSMADIDMVITDAVMPGGVSGIELSDRAAQLHPGVPVVLMSGYATESLEKKGRLRPHTPFLSKPFRRETLAAIVAKNLAARGVRHRDVFAAPASSSSDLIRMSM
jgi:PAS domain S-box-containing protein